MNSLNIIAVTSLVLAGLCMLIIIIDLLAGNKQHMMIMNVVWPVTALYSGPVGLVAYYAIGRKASHKNMMVDKELNKNKPFWQSVVVGTTHCGGGCTLGDMIVESLLFFFPFTLLGSKVLGSWVIDYIAAFILGIIFQYFSIKPMKNLSPGKALVAALKADTFSLTAWQIGMYGWMAIVIFGIVGHPLEKNDPVFWFMMQIAMLLGFCTSYGVNWILLKKAIKEVM